MLAFSIGSGLGSWGQHFGRQGMAVVRLFAERIVGAVGSERVDGLRSFGVELVEMGPVGTANGVANRGKARQMIEAGDGIDFGPPTPGRKSILISDNRCGIK